MHRRIDPYNPHADAADRWPGWTIHFTPLAGITAVFSNRQRVFLLDAAHWSGRRDEGVATVVAHLDLGHHLQPGGLSEVQVSFARCLAQTRMDRQKDRAAA